MHIRGCVSTDAGSRYGVCSDAAMLKIASSGRYGRVAFAALCDGSAPLEKINAHATAPEAGRYGSLRAAEADNEAGTASAMVIERLARWFHDELPVILSETEQDIRLSECGGGKARILTEVLRTNDSNRLSFTGRMFDEAYERIRLRLEQLAGECNVRVMGYGRMHGKKAGTTVSCLLILGSEYLLMHMGSSHAYVADSVTLKRIGRESLSESGKEAYIGGSEMIRPHFVRGRVRDDMGFLLCSDAFLRRQDPGVLHRKIIRGSQLPEKRMQNVLRSLTKNIRRRGERDDAFAVLVACER